jgi:prepilin-type N-terminal cleavage/methylation domain-containing protein
MIARVATSKGYSMIEMVVVIAIVAILVGIAVPNFLAWNQKYQLKSDVSNLAQMLSIARMTAINRNMTVNVIVCHLTTPCPAPLPNATQAQVTVFYLNATGAQVLPPNTAMNTGVSLTNVGGALVNAGVGAPQIVSFLPTGMWTNAADLGNNICLAAAAPFAPGLCTANANPTAQVVNFRDTGADNYRIVIRPTGKVTWCYVGNCAS